MKNFTLQGNVLEMVVSRSLARTNKKNMRFMLNHTREIREKNMAFMLNRILRL